MIGTKVLSVGHYQPPRVVTNADLEALVETNDEWIQRRVGIKERRWAGDEDTVEAMATKAAQDALSKSGLQPDDIDLLIVATCTEYIRSPNIAARVARGIGMTSTPGAIEINTACSGFTHAVALAQQSIASGASTTALLVGVDKLTAVTDMTDRSTCVLTADGGGAMIVTASEEQEISPVVWGSVPELADAVVIEPVDGENRFSQAGQAVFRWTTSKLPAVAKEIIEKAGLSPDDLGAIVLHQANLRIIEPLVKKIGASHAIIATDVTESGNTSAGSVPLALSKMLDEHDIPTGTPILLFAFGGGLSYAGQVIKAP